MILLLALNGCASSKPEPLDIRTNPVQIPELILPKADQFEARDVEWIIITENNYEEVFKRLETKNNPIVLFGLTANGYQNLALNLNDLRTFIQQQNSIILAYENYYIRSNSIMKDAVFIE